MGASSAVRKMRETYFYGVFRSEMIQVYKLVHETLALVNDSLQWVWESKKAISR